MKKTRVLIVEDSAVITQFLQEIINHDPRLEVAATAASAEEALEILARVAPDVISLDIHLPGMNGLEATQHIMSVRPTPIVVVSGSIEKEGLNTAINALKAGALSIVEKPVGSQHSDYAEMSAKLCTQLFIMSQVKLVRQARPSTFLKRALPVRPLNTPDGPFKAVGIVASTGGPNALMKILIGLGQDFPLPILLVQHIYPAFLAGFAAWLEIGTPFKVVIAQDGESPLPGKIYLAPPDHNLILAQERLRVTQTLPDFSQRPPGSVLFQSMAADLGKYGIGILLTGMGEDGAAGLLELCHAGGYTIAEDESTAVVFGMPAVAARIGAALEVLPLEEIAPRVMDLVSAGKKVH